MDWNKYRQQLDQLDQAGLPREEWDALSRALNRWVTLLQERAQAVRALRAVETALHPALDDLLPLVTRVAGLEATGDLRGSAGHWLLARLLPYMGEQEAQNIRAELGRLAARAWAVEEAAHG